MRNRPSLNILLKLMAVVALVIAPSIATVDVSMEEAVIEDNKIEIEVAETSQEESVAAFGGSAE